MWWFCLRILTVDYTGLVHRHVITPIFIIECWNFEVQKCIRRFDIFDNGRKELLCDYWAVIYCLRSLNLFLGEVISRRRFLNEVKNHLGSTIDLNCTNTYIYTYIYTEVLQTNMTKQSSLGYSKWILIMYKWNAKTV